MVFFLTLFEDSRKEKKKMFFQDGKKSKIKKFFCLPLFLFFQMTSKWTGTGKMENYETECN